MSQVTLTNVKKVYDGKVTAVHDFNLAIEPGEFVVFVGPSGCGKSTTLRMIAGLEEITSGTIEIAGRVVNDVHPKDRDIAMVFQNYALYPHMSVYKNMAFGLMLRKMPRPEIRRRVDEAARMLGLDQLLDRKPKALSGGQRQRVALGRAIVREPKVFLFDEPLSNLDAKLRVTTRTEIKNLHQRLRTTTIYVTHDQEEAMTLGDRIVVMSAGYVQQVDSPLGVYRRPVNRFVAAFLGSPPMNFLEGTLRRDSGIVFQGAGVRLRLPDAPGLAAALDKPVVLGFRPSAMSERQEGKFQPPPGFARGDNALRLRPKVIEPLGEMIDASCETDTGHRVIARIDAREDFPLNQPVDLYLDMQHVHVFEPGEFGRNLILAG
ncbi:MAG: sn-glycerol-3-phosphate ABC transporter ATP-binding protein UgpC [Planctomycetota bacterium]|nr:sn-glycerol-3-phosphate ABC transporter ATP-binding protein UgpC [Planctomycetota bacterium]